MKIFLPQSKTEKQIKLFWFLSLKATDIIA